MELTQFEDSIFTVRGQKVMLDANVAQALGVETKELNKNASRSPKWEFLRDQKVEDTYRFQLTQKEVETLKSQNVISRWQFGTFNNSNYLPWVYTSRGCYHFGTSLRSQEANKLAMQLSWTFDKVINSDKPEVRAIARTPEEIVLELAKVSVEHRKMIDAQNEKIENQELRLKYMEAQHNTSPDEYFTIKGFASLYDIPIDVTKAAFLGKQASKLSKEFGIRMGVEKDTRFGQVNSYHEKILTKVFENHTPQFKNSRKKIALNLNINPSFSIL